MYISKQKKVEEEQGCLDEVSLKFERENEEIAKLIEEKRILHSSLLGKKENKVEIERSLLENKAVNCNVAEHLRYLNNYLQEIKGNIRVYCRVRPFLAKEVKSQTANYIDIPNDSTLSMTLQTKTVYGVSDKLVNTENYVFDRVFGPSSTQDDVFNDISQLVQSALDGYKVCIFAYGQTGSGKTFTMEGPTETAEDLTSSAQRGVIQRSVELIFSSADKLQETGWEIDIKVKFIELYLDQVRDLLSDKKNNCISSGNRIEEGSVHPVKSIEDVYPLLTKAAGRRAKAETALNERSSRSHSIFQLHIVAQREDKVRKGTLNLIDLAGSERVADSGVTGDRLKETKEINKSLAFLGDVISALKSKNAYVPYRSTKLTFLLQDYFGGDAKTLMFVNINPRYDSHNETLNSLRFASKVNSCSIN